MCKPSLLFVIVVQLPSCIPLLATPWTESHQASLSTVSWSFLKFMSTESVMLSNHLILCCPLQSFPASGSFPVSWLFTSGGQIIGASASVLPMSIQGLFPLRLTGLISLQSKGLSSLLQHSNSKTSILWCSAFFIVQLSYPHMTTGKTIALTRRTFVSKCLSFLICCLGWSQLFFQGASVF